MSAATSITVTPLQVADLLAEPQTDGQQLVRSLDPEAVWLAHVDEPWRPSDRASI